MLPRGLGYLTVCSAGGPRIRHFEERNFRAANALTKIGHGPDTRPDHGMRGSAGT